ncbi:Iron(3+)-hydroxamate import ATP-binding protein FhuC [Planctomycetes bacterium Pan216]|uniref:Iron(3+)-hydroxamate import ATP-binding protein FhuC n=1 Tax=Kolteria novifilia TaxID=2527975 RepID=A0A518B0C0_9BACT|nr:Iron(3+)-hydroxamate import ATP-binding protein FhuC [Planctomycetes bacterium Pan216]
MILDATDVTFSYRSQPVLRGVDFHAESGLTVLLGPNGAGKSTLLKCLCGLLSPEGRVVLDGRDIATLSTDERSNLVSYLPQDLSTGACLTVFESVLIGYVHRLGWRPRAADLHQVESLLEKMGLADLSQRMITELSGGQRQMVAITQSLVRDPRVLLLDEPTSNLDIEHQFHLCGLLRRLCTERSLCVVMALHDLQVASRFADTIYVLKDGLVDGAGPPASVLTRERIASVYNVVAEVNIAADNRPLITPLAVR